MTTSVAPELLNQSSGLGYTTGSGGSVTQLTSKATAVTLNKACGQITTHDSNMNAGTSETFGVNNTFVDTSDVVVINFSGNFVGSYSVRATVYNGSFFLTLTNHSSGALAEAVVINFAVIKAVTA